MAVNPQYQWISEHKIVKSTIGVMTNVRRDHLDEMGISIDQITKSMGNTMQLNGTLVTAEDKQLSLLESITKGRNSKFYSTVEDNIDNDNISDFEYLEHKENISLAVKVCQLCGVEKDVALKGMSRCTPDPRTLTMWKINFKSNNFEFINAFATEMIPLQL